MNILLPPLSLTQLQEVDACSSCCGQVNVRLFTHSYMWSDGLSVASAEAVQMCVPDTVAAVVFESDQDLWTPIKLQRLR